MLRSSSGRYRPDTAFFAASTGQRLALEPGFYWNYNSSEERFDQAACRQYVIFSWWYKTCVHYAGLRRFLYWITSPKQAFVPGSHLSCNVGDIGTVYVYQVSLLELAPVQISRLSIPI